MIDIKEEHFTKVKDSNDVWRLIITGDYKQQILQDYKLRKLVNNINWEEAIEHLHRYDIISPYSRELRQQLVDLHYKLIKIRKIIEEENDRD